MMENTNDSREAILAKIKSSKPKARPLPEIPVWDVPGRPLQNFISHLKGFDGGYRLFHSRQAAEAWLLADVIKKAEADGKKVFSAVPDMEGNVTLKNFKNPSEMHVIDICIAETGLAVGETGSMLVDSLSLGSPAAALFSTDLYLLIDRRHLIAGLQEAYSKIDLTGSRYSAFFSGPSATADIEAVHITGAQGEISLTAVIYNCTDEDEREVEEIMDRLPQGTPLGQPDAPILSLRRESDPAKGQDSI